MILGITLKKITQAHKAGKDNAINKDPITFKTFLIISNIFNNILSAGTHRFEYDFKLI